MKKNIFLSRLHSNMKSIVNCALSELGLSEKFLLHSFILCGGRPKIGTSGEWLLEKIDVAEWSWITTHLYLPIDCLTLGYQRKQHKMWVGDAIVEGAYLFPKTGRLEDFFREYISDKRQDIKWELTHQGDLLRERTKIARFEERKARRKIRRINLKLGTKSRIYFSKIYYQSHQPIKSFYTPSMKRKWAKYENLHHANEMSSIQV